ncbi:hypothetical protein ISN75_12045 [Dyella marensis]|uniref:hypothetical protein n=1 Tax=Dyella marensis TaxID=500610 RepID=UPI0031E22D28
MAGRLASGAGSAEMAWNPWVDGDATAAWMDAVPSVHAAIIKGRRSLSMAWFPWDGAETEGHGLCVFSLLVMLAFVPCLFVPMGMAYRPVQLRSV